MDTAYWTYLDDRHPMYDRPSDARRWEFAQRGLRPAEYDVPDGDPPAYTRSGAPYPQGEDLSMGFDTLPSLRWRQGPGGNTILTFSLRSAHIADMDLSAVVEAARSMWLDFKAHSRGPYSRHDLRALNHPYGYGTPDEPPTWEKLTRPRKVPRYGETLLGRRSIGHVKGIRGSVPTMSVVNRTTGEFEGAWRWSYAVRGDGLTLTFWNERRSERGAPIAWFLAHGTVKMQAHGPWEVVPRAHWGAIVGAWSAAARVASQERALAEGLYGADDFD